MVDRTTFDELIRKEMRGRTSQRGGGDTARDVVARRLNIKEKGKSPFKPSTAYKPTETKKAKGAEKSKGEDGKRKQRPGSKAVDDALYAETPTTGPIPEGRPDVAAAEEGTWPWLLSLLGARARKRTTGAPETGPDGGRVTSPDIVDAESTRIQDPTALPAPERMSALPAPEGNVMGGVDPEIERAIIQSLISGGAAPEQRITMPGGTTPDVIYQPTDVQPGKVPAGSRLGTRWRW